MVQKKFNDPFVLFAIPGFEETCFFEKSDASCYFCSYTFTPQANYSEMGL